MNRQLEVILKPWERRRLQKIRDHSPTPAAGWRAVYPLLSANRASSKLIVQPAHLFIDAVTDIRRRWQQQGFGCMKDRPRRKACSKATPAYRKELRRAPEPTLNSGINESEAHLHPHLTRAWMRRGRQQAGSAPSQNHKLTIFGPWYYSRGLFLHYT